MTVLGKTSRWRRHLQMLVVALMMSLGLSGCAVFTEATGPEKPQIPEPTTPPLSFDGFNHGDIISDRVFYNYKSMDEAAIRAFIKKVGYGCRDGQAPCLTNWRGELPHFKADRFCEGEIKAGHQVDAAKIIYESARACRVNPQVLLILLQKEQGLLTASSYRLMDWRYQSATGFACPDGGTCDKHYAGLPKQVYAAARQFQRYRKDPKSFRYKPGQTYKIAYGPDSRCGSERITIKNQATANLYNYTPYAANDLALRGIQDDCATPAQTYFYAYFQAWFGSTHAQK